MSNPLKPTKRAARSGADKDGWRAEIGVAARGLLLRDEPLSRHTTLGIGGPADLLFEPSSTADLVAALETASKHGVGWRVLGGGSNLLVGDEGVRGLLVRLPHHLSNVDVTGHGDMVRVSYCAGMSTAAAHRHAAESQLVGMEFLAGIPGTLGGAARMNAGARLGEMSDVVDGVEVVLPEGARWHPSGELDFSYRRSTLPKGSVITRVAVLLRQAGRSTLDALGAQVEAEISRRRETQPRGKSAGSTFKNPPADTAGRLMDACGLKGRRVGGAFVSDVHANFLMNDGTATAKDMIELIEVCRERVLADFGVSLELEVELMGEFR